MLKQLREATRPETVHDKQGELALGQIRPWLAGLAVTVAGLLFLPTPVLAQTDGAPLPLNVSENAQPIWSPNRPTGSSTEAAQAAPSNTLRLLQNGWGQNRQAATTSSTSNVLRWTSHKPTPSTGISIPLQAANWQEQQQDTTQSQVRTVSHEQPADPFADPFGDRVAQRDSIYQPPQTNGAAPEIAAPKLDGDQSSPQPDSLPTLDDLLRPRDEGATQPSTPPATGIEFPGADALDLPESEMTKPAPPAELAPSESSTPPRQPAPLPKEELNPGFPPPTYSTPKPKASNNTSPRYESPSQPFENPQPLMDAPAAAGDENDADSCKRNYAGRDCCAEDIKCRTARQTLKQNSIRNISLDITATFKPDAETVEEEQQAAQDRLRQMPSRVWKDVAGRFLAEGRVVDLHHRRIVIQQADGSERELEIGNLNEDCQCFLAAWWRVPTECGLGYEKYVARSWEPQTFTWTASALCHKPLYFEERQLERYGHTMGPLVQPVMSGAHFFLNVAVMPYKMGINPPIECQYSLGYYRPGSCSPWLLPPAPISLRGALFEAGAVTGVALLFP